MLDEAGVFIAVNTLLAGVITDGDRVIGVIDNYIMFVKCNYKIPGSVINRDDIAKAELEIRKRQAKAAELFRKYVPGCEKAFMARTSPSLNIRRGRPRALLLPFVPQRILQHVNLLTAI